MELLHNLPNEIISVVFSFIPPREAFGCEIVSIHFLSRIKFLNVWKIYQQIYGFEPNPSSRDFQTPYRIWKAVFQTYSHCCLICNTYVISDYLMIISGCLLETKRCLFCSQKKNTEDVSSCRCRKYPICHPECMHDYYAHSISSNNKLSLYRCPLCSKTCMGVKGMVYL